MEACQAEPPDETAQTENKSNEAKAVLDNGESSTKQDINSNTIHSNAENVGDDKESSSKLADGLELKDKKEMDGKKKNDDKVTDSVMRDISTDDTKTDEKQTNEKKEKPSSDPMELVDFLKARIEETSSKQDNDENKMCTDCGTNEDTQVKSEIKKENPVVKVDAKKMTKEKESKKMKRKKRSYRKQKNEGTEEADDNETHTNENKMDIDGDNPDAKPEQDLDVEGLENCKISEVASSSGKSSHSSKLKRSKCKSSQQSSAEHKKRKKAIIASPDKKHEQPQSSNADGGKKSSEETKNEQCDETVLTDSEDDDNDKWSTSSSQTNSLWSSSSSSNSSRHSSDNEHENKTETVLTDDEEWLEKHTGVLSFPKWQALQQLQKRELGCFNQAWQQRVCGSAAMVKKLDQQFTLDAHEGCVNALHFNQTGTLLASGSDDLDIHIWDWSSMSPEPFISYNSGHRSNVFQAKFMPNSSDLTVVSAARDGQVRVGYLSSTGSCRDTKKLAQHRGSAHKLALDSAGCKSTFLSCGEDSVVLGFDLRETKASKKLVSVKQGDQKIPLYSIDTSPHQPQQFAVSGRDQWARVYDRRMLNPEAPETVAGYCPHHLENAPDNTKANITCLVYNYDGSELLCSYNDEDIYLFDTSHSTGCEFTRKYKGHRNNATVKGVNFYGPRSEFVVSGSDCGNIFLWDKASSKVVQFMQGDDGGVVNVLEPHPNLPLLATSGLDKNIKIWGPTGDGSLNEEKLKKLMLSNRQERHDESNEGHVIDSHLLWFLMRSLRNASGRRRHRRDDDDDSSDSSSNDSSEDSDRESRGDRRRMDCLTS